MSRPTVTCVVCAYNYERFLPEALDSALAQRYPSDRVEVLVVDDGSTDGTPAVLAGYGDRIRVIRQANAGLTAATAAGFAAATGELVAILDADDAWHPDKLRRQVDLLEAQPEVGLVFSDMATVDADGGLIASSYFGVHGLRPPRGRALGAFLAQSFAPASTIMFRRSLLDHVLPFAPEASCQDWWLALRAGEVSELDWVPESLVRYRIHDQNMSAAGDGGAKWLATVRDDNTFRRWMFAHLDLSGVSFAELEAAWGKLEQHALMLAARTGSTVEQELPVTAADHGAWQARLQAVAVARAAGDHRAAALASVAAMAANPFDPVARAAFADAKRADAQAPARPAPGRARRAARVSVVVSAGDGGRFLGQALDSVLAQDHPPLEILFVDDGSAAEAADRLARFGDAVRTIRIPSVGPDAARDAGIAAARGDYLTFLDTSDSWPRDRLRRLSDVLDAHPEVGLVYGDTSLIDGAGRTIQGSLRAALGGEAASGRPLGRLLDANVIPTGALMVRAALKAHFHPIGAQACDQGWWIAARVAACAEVRAIDAVVDHRREPSGSPSPTEPGASVEELGFRHWLLTTTDPALVTVGELVDALAGFDAMAHRLAGAPAGSRPRSDRAATLAAMRSASAALDEPDLPSAAAWLVRAAALDPADPEPRELLGQLLPLLDEPLRSAA